jgi:hypothetical protein
MRTLFLGARYKVQHKDITPENVTEMLKDDLRSKLMGGHPQSWIYPSNLCIPGTDIKYVGGFYYEPGDGGQYSIVNSEMDEIDRADIVCLDFTKPNAIATIAELFYALKKEKEIHIFIDPTLTTPEITSEYWFIFYTMDRMYGEDNVPSNVTRHYVKSEEEIVEIIKTL